MKFPIRKIAAMGSLAVFMTTIIFVCIRSYWVADCFAVSWSNKGVGFGAESGLFGAFYASNRLDDQTFSYQGRPPVGIDAFKATRLCWGIYIDANAKYPSFSVHAIYILGVAAIFLWWLWGNKKRQNLHRAFPVN
jgi:hypothetical protein